MNDGWHPIPYDAAGLRGRRARIIVEHPFSSSLADSDLPPGTRDVIIVDDTTSVFLNLTVHPVGSPSRRALIRYDQVVVADQPCSAPPAGIEPAT
ncbi:DUF7161 family protein [Tsukamurella pulmonis]|uniref:DUF7161 family protein n=1 Tax=Tsukamurella pulmonis TaxID=47312 RepID=UPI0009EB232B|nr:hypothetical protein [Tsukamurella pulmonis]RDH11453.1 ubiD family decarboxylase [Tsukamurella pulmonis]